MSLRKMEDHHRTKVFGLVIHLKTPKLRASLTV
jgi:hypothetical protein